MLYLPKRLPMGYARSVSGNGGVAQMDRRGMLSDSEIRAEIERLGGDDFRRRVESASFARWSLTSNPGSE